MMCSKVTRAFALVISLTVILQPATAQSYTPRYVSMTPGTNGYYEYLPQGYNPTGSQTYPVILFIHGLGEIGPGTAATLPMVNYNGTPRHISNGTFPNSFTINGQTSSFIVITPQWTAWPLNYQIDSVLNYIASHYKADMSRVYLTGLSAGGAVTWEYPGNNATYANRITAIVPICGASGADLNRARTIANANIAVWAFHNELDDLTPSSYSVDYVNMINQAPAPNPLAKVTIWPGAVGHDAWTKAYDPSFYLNGINIYQWMLLYKRGVTPPPPNLAPVANAGVDQILPGASSAVLSGTGIDPDGTIATVKWTKVSGPAQYTINSPNSLNTTITGFAQGSYTFRLTVFDNMGYQHSDDVNIIIPPVLPAHIEAEDYTNMSGIVTEYTQDVGWGMNLTLMENNDWVDYYVSAPLAATYTVKLRIASGTGNQMQIRKSDGTVLQTVTVPNTGGFQSWQTITTTVNLPAGVQKLRLATTGVSGSWSMNWLQFLNSAISNNLNPTVMADPDKTITLPTNNTLLSAFASDPDGTISTYTWSKISGGPAVFTNTNTATVGVSGLTAGTYIFNVVVTDNAGGTASDELVVTVNPGTGVNQAPTVSIPTPGAITLPANSVTLNGTATDDGTITAYSWTKISGGTANFSSTTTASTTVSGLQQGSYTFRLTVTDNGGLTASADVVVTVNPSTPVNQPPVVSIPAPAALTLPTNSLTLTGTATDDGTIISYAWTKVSGGAASFSSTNTASTTISGLAQGSYTFRLTVTDNGGLTGSADVVVTVNPAATTSTRIEAENYTNMFGVLKESCWDVDLGQDLHWIENGDWMEYLVNVPTAGTFALNLRIATPAAGAQLQVRNSSGTVLKTINLPNTNGYQSWQTVSTTITLPQGQQTLRFVSTAATLLNFNWFEIAGASSITPPPPPPPPVTTSVRIEAESYTNMFGVFKESCWDVDLGQDVHWIENGDWMEYSINPATASTYTLNFRIAAPAPGAQMQVRKADGTVLGTLNIPNTGGYQNWQTITGSFNLPAGPQTIRIVSTAAPLWNFNWFQIVTSGTGTTSVQTTVLGELEPMTVTGVQVFPNPVQNNVMLRTGLKGKLKVEIVNMNGIVVKQFRLENQNAGPAQFNLSIGELNKGSYILRLSSKEAAQTLTITKL